MSVVVQIKVFVTKTHEFRAKIKEHGSSTSYEITVGGVSWKEGKAAEHQAVIKKKCELLVLKLTDKLLNLK